MGGSAPPDAMFNDVFDAIRGRYADGVDEDDECAFDTTVDWASCMARNAEGAGGGGL